MILLLVDNNFFPRNTSKICNKIFVKEHVKIIIALEHLINICITKSRLRCSFFLELQLFINETMHKYGIYKSVFLKVGKSTPVKLRKELRKLYNVTKNFRTLSLFLGWMNYWKGIV
jgi:hypothetical protein